MVVRREASSAWSETSKRGMGEHLVCGDVWHHACRGRTALLQTRYQHSDLGSQGSKAENGGEGGEVQVRAPSIVAFTFTVILVEIESCV